jgi:hypothetical protein
MCHTAWKGEKLQFVADLLNINPIVTFPNKSATAHLNNPRDVIYINKVWAAVCRTGSTQTTLSNHNMKDFGSHRVRQKGLMKMVLLTLLSSGSKLWLIEIHAIPVSETPRTASGHFTLNSSTKRTTRSFTNGSCGSPGQHETVVPAATACSYTAEWRWQSMVTGPQQ